MTASMHVLIVPDNGAPFGATIIEQPLSIWGPTDPRPTPPISGIPGLPGYEPPVGSSPGVPTHPIALPGDPWWGQDLHPEHPIVIPPPGEVPPDAPPGTGDMNCRWGYQEVGGWKLFCVYDPQGGGKPRPPG